MHSREALLIQRSKEANMGSDLVTKWLLWVLARLVTTDDWERSLENRLTPDEVWRSKK